MPKTIASGGHHATAKGARQASIRCGGHAERAVTNRGPQNGTDRNGSFGRGAEMAAMVHVDGVAEPKRTGTPGP